MSTPTVDWPTEKHTGAYSTLAGVAIFLAFAFFVDSGDCTFTPRQGSEVTSVARGTDKPAGVHISERLHTRAIQGTPNKSYFRVGHGPTTHIAGLGGHLAA